MGKKQSTSAEIEGVFIKELMDERRLKNKDIAELMGTSDVNVSRLLSGERGLSLDWLLQFAKALNVHISELFLPPQSPSFKKASGEKEVKKLLRQIDGLPEDALEPLWGLVTFYLPKGGAQSEHSPSRDQPEPANLRRSPAP